MEPGPVCLARVDPRRDRGQILAMVQINEVRLAELCEKHDVRVLKLFGSAARGEARPDSDIDLIVEFDGDKSLFDLIALELELEELLGRDVDLLTEPALSPYLRDRILASAAVVYERAG
jgi:predicted nucleotidyltransferase